MSETKVTTALTVIEGALPPSMADDAWAEGILDALEDEGYTVARLERVGTVGGVDLWRKAEGDES